MNDRAFLDTNILVYAYDTHETEKQMIAQAILAEGIEKENLVLSVQVLGEFFNVVTKHIKSPMSPDEAQDVIKTIGHLPVQDIDLSMVNRAIDIHRTYQISYWDSLIVAAAERTNCSTILSEDLNEGQMYHGILIRNPLRTDQGTD
jgi:predicted nucleic acid-binding protein